MLEHIFKVLVIVIAGLVGFFSAPIHDDASFSALVFAGVAVAISLLFVALERSTVGMIIGGLMGLLISALVAWVLTGSLIPALFGTHMELASLATAALSLALVALGTVFGYFRGKWLTPHNIKAMVNVEEDHKSYKILDTSVIIDGRIADISEAGFLGGILVVPQFVLKELQQIADSSQSLKRNRGRRGLDVLQEIKKKQKVKVIFPEQDFADVQEVDLKLIELARLLSGKIVTNDFNLNKVAQLRGVEVLNINELANALKPVVLPGEIMKVFILKEGKEDGQGIGYLDDGTMVVVDNSSKLIGNTVELVVTSVLQTTAGKMIFGKLDTGSEDH